MGRQATRRGNAPSLPTLLLLCTALLFWLPAPTVTSAAFVAEPPRLSMTNQDGAAIAGQALFPDARLQPGLFTERVVVARNDGRAPLDLSLRSTTATPEDLLWTADAGLQATLVDVTHDRVLYIGALRDLARARPLQLRPADSVTLRLAVGLPSRVADAGPDPAWQLGQGIQELGEDAAGRTTASAVASRALRFDLTFVASTPSRTD